MKRHRLDVELVRRKIVTSRERAQQLISEGSVIVNGVTASKPASQVEPSTSIKVKESDGPSWASRGAHKLLGALDAFQPLDIAVDGAVCLDAGASTGGFTDVLLHHGAQRVIAADVGYGQLIWRLQNDDRVEVRDKTNVRYLSAETLGTQVDLVVGDLSFISMKMVLPALVDCTRGGGMLLPMVKPQFEVGKDRLGNKGVVTSNALRKSVVVDVALQAITLGCEVVACTASPLPGPQGNVEYFLALHKTSAGQATDSQSQRERIEQLVSQAIQAGPQ